MHTVMGRADSFGWYEMGGARPITVIIDRQGVVREYFIGDREYGDFEEKVTRYL
jgi:peroxiredoxin